MAERISLTKQIYVNGKVTSVDFKYGPYENLEHAYRMLGDNKYDCITNGLTFGINEEDGSVTEYWFDGGTSFEHIKKKMDVEKIDHLEVDSITSEVFG